MVDKYAHSNLLTCQVVGHFNCFSSLRTNAVDTFCNLKITEVRGVSRFRHLQMKSINRIDFSFNKFTAVEKYILKTFA